MQADSYLHDLKDFRDLIRVVQEPAVYQLYTSEYAKTEGLYYAGMVPFNTILKRIKENFDRL